MIEETEQQKTDELARSFVQQLENLPFSQAESVLRAANAYLGFIKRDTILKVDLSQY